MTDLLPAGFCPKKAAVPILSALMLLAMIYGCSAETTGVHDPGHLLSAELKDPIEKLHQVLSDDLDIDFFLVISAIPVPEIDRAAPQWFNKHRVGRISHGIEAAIELLVTRVRDATAGEPFDPIKEIGPAFLSGGAGADIGYDKNDTLPRSVETVKQVAARRSPQAVLEAYKTVLANHNKRADLMLYSPESKIFFSRWTVTDAQYDNVLRGLRSHDPEKIIIRDSRAVIKYPVMQREQSPFLLVRSDDGWMFDFATMNRVIGMNHKNQWHFLTQDHPYMFGFKDLHFDKNGFPFKLP